MSAYALDRICSAKLRDWPMALVNSSRAITDHPATNTATTYQEKT